MIPFVKTWLQLLLSNYLQSQFQAFQENHNLFFFFLKKKPPSEDTSNGKSKTKIQSINSVVSLLY